jgi:hypothetical protein
MGGYRTPSLRLSVGRFVVYPTVACVASDDTRNVEASYMSLYLWSFIRSQPGIPAITSGSISKAPANRLFPAISLNSSRV